MFNIPKAAKAIPYIPANLKEIKIVIAIHIMGIMQERYPKANPRIMLIAAPDLHDSANLITGLKVKMLLILFKVNLKYE